METNKLDYKVIETYQIPHFGRVEIINSPDLSKDTVKELIVYEDEISTLTGEINNILNKLAEYKVP